MATSGYKKEVLLDDERNRGIAAMVKYGPYLFVAGSDGHRDLKTEKVDPELYNKPTLQCHNAYGRVARRLTEAGFAGSCAVWIQNFTSGQHWRIERMGTWPDHFGEAEHSQAVSFGAQCWMSGINMLTAVVMGVTPDLPRSVGVAQPHRGRASRVTRCGQLVYVIGVRGRENTTTKQSAPEETPDAFPIQLGNCYDNMKSHLNSLGSKPGAFLRVDSCVRDIGRLKEWDQVTRDYHDGSVPFAAYTVGTILGSRGEMEVGGVAVAPGEKKDVAWFEHAPQVAQATRGGGLVFASGCSGLCDAKGTIQSGLSGDRRGQVRQALKNAEAALARFDVGREAILRLDAFVSDIYFEDDLIAEFRSLFGKNGPAISVMGAAPANGAAIDISVIAGAG